MIFTLKLQTNNAAMAGFSPNWGMTRGKGPVHDWPWIVMADIEQKSLPLSAGQALSQQSIQKTGGLPRVAAARYDLTNIFCPAAKLACRH
jgi:hypothetical protein